MPNHQELPDRIRRAAEQLRDELRRDPFLRNFDVNPARDLLDEEAIRELEQMKYVNETTASSLPKYTIHDYDSPVESSPETVPYDLYERYKEKAEYWEGRAKNMKKEIMSLHEALMESRFLLHEYEKANPLNLKLLTTKVNLMLKKKGLPYKMDPEAHTQAAVVREIAELLWYLKSNAEAEE